MQSIPEDQQMVSFPQPNMPSCSDSDSDTAPHQSTEAFCPGSDSSSSSSSDADFVALLEYHPYCTTDAVSLLSSLQGKMTTQQSGESNHPCATMSFWRTNTLPILVECVTPKQQAPRGIPESSSAPSRSAAPAPATGVVGEVVKGLLPPSPSTTTTTKKTTSCLPITTSMTETLEDLKENIQRIFHLPRVPKLEVLWWDFDRYEAIDLDKIARGNLESVLGWIKSRDSTDKLLATY
ncbi:MAG: hypothetical protein Q9163_004194 [Psora crenata]